MGVQGLWNLVAPAGRRIKIETLEGKVLAIDVSIWLLKMIHGYLQLGSEEYKNVHLTGIFRRIVKLLFYGIKPVFVFDGKFPELKRETVRKRQEYRDRRRVDLKKVAQKFLSKVLEDRLKETVGRVLQPRRPSQSPTKSRVFGGTSRGCSGEIYVLVGMVEDEMKEEEQQEESKVFEDDQVFDYEFDFIVNENQDLLAENGVDLEEFYLQDTETQYAIVKRVKDKMRDNKIKKYLEIDNLDDLSKLHVQDYVKNIQRKNKLEKTREEAYSKKLELEQEMAIGNLKLKDLQSTQYIQNFFKNPKSEVVKGSLASDRTKGYMYLTQKNEQYDTQVMKVEKRRGSKNERLKKLSAQLREIAQNTEAQPHIFNFDELICDNPLEAFKFINNKAVDTQIRMSQALNESPDKNPQENETTQPKEDIDEIFGFDDWDQQEGDGQKEEEPEVKEEPAKDNGDNDSLEDLFEYDVSQDIKEEEIPKIEESHEEDKTNKMAVESLTKASMTAEEEEADYQARLAKRNIRKITGNYAKFKAGDFSLPETEEQEESQKKKVNLKTKQVQETQGNFSIKVLSLEDFSVSAEPPQKEKEQEKEKEKEKEQQQQQQQPQQPKKGVLKESKYSPYQGDSNTITEPEPKAVQTTEKKVQFKVLEITPEKPRGAESSETNQISPVKEVFTQKELKKSPSLETNNNEISWFQRLVKDSQVMPSIPSSQILSQSQTLSQSQSQVFPSNSQVMPNTQWTQDYLGSNSQSAEKKKQDEETEEMFEEFMNGKDEVEEEQEGGEMEIISSNDKEKVMKEMEIVSSKKDNKKEERNMDDFMYEDFDWDNMDEEKLLKEMKDLDETENVDKWTLMQEFQKFQNLSEFESGSIQEKFNEIKELLVLFGIPWVESPTEAEAQCSFLEQAGLVDGIITDDSDVFLFGGRQVYRNIFEKGDFAHAYKMAYIENEMALNRQQLILLALFLGSDYTLGIRGVGIVNAIEIVTAFDTPEALKRFKEWAEVPDVLLENASEHYRNVPQKELEYKLYHRNFKKHWELPDDFPDYRVISGYMDPTVDQSKEKFEWGKPDFSALERFCESRFKWDENRIFNLLEPLKKVIRDKGNQNKITDYFREEKIAEVASKRINEAIKNLKKSGAEEREMPATITKSIENIIEQQNPNNIARRRHGDYANEIMRHYAFDKKKVKKNN